MFTFLYECFSHFNVQQLLSNLSHFVLFSFDFIEFRILRYVLHCSNFFGARLENPKINKRGVLITAGSRKGSYCFYKKIKREGAFIRDLTVDFMQRSIKARYVALI